MSVRLDGTPETKIPNTVNSVRCFSIECSSMLSLETSRYSVNLLQMFKANISFSAAYMDRIKRIWYLSRMQAAMVQASLRIRAVSPEPPLLAHTSSESRGTFRQKARSLASLNGWACAVKTCHDGMLEDTNSLDGAHSDIVVEQVRRVFGDN